MLRTISRPPTQKNSQECLHNLKLMVQRLPLGLTLGASFLSSPGSIAIHLWLQVCTTAHLPCRIYRFLKAPPGTQQHLPASATVMVPCFPTFSKASATILPMPASPFAEMVATFQKSGGCSSMQQLDANSRLDLPGYMAAELGSGALLSRNSSRFVIVPIRCKCIILYTMAQKLNLHGTSSVRSMQRVQQQHAFCNHK